MFYKVKIYYFKLIFNIFDIKKDAIIDIRYFKILTLFYKAKTSHF